MAKMPNSLRAWKTPQFTQTLKEEMETFRRDVLPLEGLVEKGNALFDDDLGVTVLGVSEGEGFIQAKVGVFFAEIINCVSCGESDPIDEAYCEMEVRIDKETAEAHFSVIPE